MKNIIYISLIASILFGCKGNSFLTQRYTKYGHSVAKKSEDTKSQERRSQAVVKNESTQSVELKNEENLVSESVETKTKVTPSVVGIAKVLVKLPKKFASKVTFGNQESVSDAVPLDLSTKSEITVGQKVEKAKQHSVSKAIIGKILKIIVLILTIVLVLIIVGVLFALGIIGG